MEMIKTGLVAVFALFTFNAPVAAFELPSLSREDVRCSAPAPETEFLRPALAEVTDPVRGLDPVVITISGLRFGEIGWGSAELRNILRVARFFFRKDVSEDDVVNGIVYFSPRYFFPEDEEDGRSIMDARLPDDYLELKLQEIPGYDQHDVKVVPFPWSRDPEDSKTTIPALQAKIAEVYDAYKGSGRPIYILAHSWGSVLAHTALHRLYEARPDVRIDKFITAGSPLVPANIVVRLFMKVEKIKEGLKKKVTKPANVAIWRNVWAMRDAYSNAIPAADSNYQADAEVENLEPTLIQLILHNKLLKKQARRDLFTIRDIKAWHGAYFYDYRAELKSLQKEIYVPVFRPILAPQVVNRGD